MGRLSSIFSFDTLVGRPRLTRSLCLTIALCAAFRFGLLAVAGRLDHIPARAIFQRYVEVEDQAVRRATARPKIVLMGNSMMRYGLLEDQIAAAAGLKSDEVVNLSLEGGQAWDARLFVRRNPEFFQDVRLVIFNTSLSELQEPATARRAEHLYRFSSLSEKLAVDGRADRALMVLDWLWPYHSERRDLVTWGLGLVGQSDRTGQEGIRPAWEPAKMARLRAQKQRLESHLGPAPTGLLGSGGTGGSSASGRAVRAREAADPEVGGWPEGTSAFHTQVLVELVEYWRQSGVRVLLVGMPGWTTYYQARRLDEVSQSRLVRFDAVMRSLADERVAYVAWRTGADAGLDDDADFMDMCHLTPCGARKFTDLIIGRLAALGWLETPRPDATALSLSRVPDANP